MTKVKYLAIQHNSDKRPCGWAMGENKNEVLIEALRQYLDHQCYAGEEMGELQIIELPIKEGAEK